MAKKEIEFDGKVYEFKSKKEMLIQVGHYFLKEADSRMTLRQLYYRFVAHDLIDNKQSQYQYLGEAIKEARINGRIDWDMIEDRTRSTDAGDYNDGEVVDPQDRFDRNLEWFKNTDERFHRPKWEGQDNYVEVWVEKEALAGIFADVCDDMNVISFPNRGYTSITLLKEAAERIREETAKKVPPMGDRKEAHILYFGDFDPSGQDIERNIRDKLHDTFGVRVNVERYALTRDQIDRYQLPPQPAKTTDARYESFVEEHGNMAVELDALPPEELKELIRSSVQDYFDEAFYQDEILPEQEKDREKINEELDRVLDDGEV
jgi:hypothetical protein